MTLLRESNEREWSVQSEQNPFSEAMFAAEAVSAAAPAERVASFHESSTPFAETAGETLSETESDRLLEQAVAGKKAGGRSIIVRYFRTAGAIERCHILFVCGSERDSMPQIVQRCARDNTLTVGDFDEFTGASGMIRFLTQDNRLRFEVNLEAMNRGGLKISAKLLKLAQIYGR